MSAATDAAVAAAMEHGAMSCFDGLHDSVFDAACQCQTCDPPEPPPAPVRKLGMLDDEAEHPWRAAAMYLGALLTGLLSAHWWPGVPL